MSVNWLIVGFLSVFYALCFIGGNNVKYVLGLIGNVFLVIISRLIAIAIIYIQKFLIGKLLIRTINFKWELVSVVFMILYSIVFFSIAYSAIKTIQNIKGKVIKKEV
jgi:hypothetical protein